MDTTIVEHLGQPQSTIEMGHSVGSQLTSLAQHLLLRTQALAAEHSALQHQQQSQSIAQNAALMAVQALTETSVRNPTHRPSVIVEMLGEALTATQASLHEQFQHMRLTQDEQAAQIERFVNDCITQALQEVQREISESKFASSAQDEETLQRLNKVTTKVDEEHERIERSMQQLVESKLTAFQSKVRQEQDAHFLSRNK